MSIPKPLPDFLKLILAFAPWIAFLIIARDSLFRLKLGLVIALVLSIAMGVAKLHRGIILWAGLLFFAFATTAVVVFENTWTVQHMGVLANALAGSIPNSSERTLLLPRSGPRSSPRTHFWREEKWHNSYILPPWQYEVLSYALLTGAAVFSVWYPDHIRRMRQRPAR